MDCQRIFQYVVALTSLLLLSACSAGPPGAISGRVEDIDLKEPMEDVQIVLCRLPKSGGENTLAEGPIISDANHDALEPICTLQAELTALTDENGEFLISDAPPGTYLLLQHIYPDEFAKIPTENWDGIKLTKSDMCEEVEEEVTQLVACEAPENAFWESGGPLMGEYNWVAMEGWTFIEGNACSNELGLCFSVKDSELAHVIEVQPEETVNVELVVYLNRPED